MGKRLDKRGHNKIKIWLLSFFILFQMTASIAIVVMSFWTITIPQDFDDSTSLPENAPCKLEEPTQVEEPLPVVTPTPQAVDRGNFVRTKVAPEIDLTKPSGIDATRLKIAVSGVFSDLAGVFCQAEEETGVNALFLIATSALESGWGESELAHSHNNIFGWTDPDSPDGFMYFDSKADCIMYVAYAIKANYLSQDGKYFEGFTIRDINEHYCSKADWSRKVLEIMYELEDTYNGLDDR
jgi:hypothetical protein